MLPGVRSFISLPAGVARMPFVRFAVLTTAGSIPWNLALAYVGYVFGANWERLQGYFHRSDLVFYALSACVAIAVIAWSWWGWRSARTSAQGCGSRLRHARVRRIAKRPRLTSSPPRS